MKVSEYLSPAEQLNYAWLNLKDEEISIENPLACDDEYFSENPHLHIFNLFRNPDNFPFTCKSLFGIEITPFQHAILKELWIRPFPLFVASRGASKTYLLAVYTILKALFHQGSRIVVAGGAFRQSKFIFENIERIWNNAPIFQDVVKLGGRDNLIRKDIDRWYFRLGTSEGYAIPIGPDGSKIRGLRANVTIADEFRSMNEVVYQQVIEAFGSVTSDVIGNIKLIARHKKLREQGVEISEQQTNRSILSNQSIISGSAGYMFESFGRYWKKYRGIIESKGDVQKLKEALGGDIQEGFDWRDYSIIRLPYDLLPEGMMDKKHISRAKSTSSSVSFNLEYGAVFADDSDGFFKRSLIEECTARPAKPVMVNNVPITFSAQIHGQPNKKYVYGIDPASEADNFAIVILEVSDNCRKIVHCWTTTRQKFKNKVGKGLAVDKDFYGYINRKVRELLKVFPSDHIALDKQGGGVGVIEAFQNPAVLKDGEVAILPYVRYGTNDPFWWEDEEKDTDALQGSHIVHICQFANAQFTSEANHGMRQDMESKILLFPDIDQIALEVAMEKDKEAKKMGMEVGIYDNLEDCMMEINDMKDELASIVHSITDGGRERWDTPEVKVEGMKKGRARKDRYTALCLANMAARTLEKRLPTPAYESMGGYAVEIGGAEVKEEKKSTGQLYYGNPKWKIAANTYDNALVSRG